MEHCRRSGRSTSWSVVGIQALQHFVAAVISPTRGVGSDRYLPVEWLDSTREGDVTSPVTGWKRLVGLRSELERIKEKRELARAHGADPAALAMLDESIAMLSNTIGKAAVAEARRELHTALSAARALRDGRPPPPQPAAGSPGDPDPDSGPDKNDKKGEGEGNGGGGGGGGGGSGAGGSGSGGGGGGGSGGGGGGGFFAIPEAPGPRGDQVTAPEPTVVHVRSENTVWTWNRYRQSWSHFTFSSPIIEVKDIGGGLLVIAEHGAVIWDAKLCEWLPALATEQLLITQAGQASQQGQSGSGASASTPAKSVPASLTVPTVGAHGMSTLATSATLSLAPLIPADLLTNAGVPPATAVSPDPNVFPPPPAPDPAEPESNPDDDGGF